MKKKYLGVILIASFLIIASGFLQNVSAEIDVNELIVEPDKFSFAIQETAVINDDLSKFNQEDWFYIENVEPGLLSIEVSWDSSYDLNCYISTSASSSTALAQGISSDNPESCSFEIQTAGTYYIGITMNLRGRIVVTPYTAIVSFNTGTSDPDITDPEVSITAPINGVTVGDTISIMATASDLESGMDYATCSFGGISLGIDSSSPYEWSFDTTTIANGTYDIIVTAYDNAGNSANDLITVNAYNEYVNPNPSGEKIAVFFWASDAGIQANIDEYWAVLENEGYTTKFDFMDTSNFVADFQTVENYEDPEDTVFFYFFGHGNNNGEDSLTAFAPGTSIIYSSELRVLFDTLDAERVGYLIESCHSGGFPVDFHAEPYLAMSTSDEDHNSYALSTLPGEGLFSDAFFDHVLDGFNAVDSFYFAEQVVFDSARNPHFMQYPMIADYSIYEWFN